MCLHRQFGRNSVHFFQCFAIDVILFRQFRIMRIFRHIGSRFVLLNYPANRPVSYLIRYLGEYDALYRVIFRLTSSFIYIMVFFLAYKGEDYTFVVRRLTWNCEQNKITKSFDNLPPSLRAITVLLPITLRWYFKQYEEI